MAINQQMVLEAINEAEAPISAEELAKELNVKQANIRFHTFRLKQKGLISGESKEGWKVTDKGRGAVERGEEIPVTTEDVGADNESKLRYFGQLAGVKTEKIEAAWAIIQTGDPDELEFVWDAFGQVDIPADQRRVFFNLWRNFKKKPLTPRLIEEMEVKAEDELGGKGIVARGARDWMLIDDRPVHVGEGLGEYTRDEAFRLYQIDRIGSKLGGKEGPFKSVDDMLTVFDHIEKLTGKKQTKPLIVVPTEEGMEVREIEEGQPITIKAPTSTGKTVFINHKGKVEELEPGQPIVINKEVAKGFIVDQTGNVKELSPGQPIVVKQVETKSYLINQAGELTEVEAGKPIIIRVEAPPAAGNKTMLEVKDKDGNPMVLDIDSLISYKRFEGEEKRADERNKILRDAVDAFKNKIAPSIAKAVDTVAKRAGKRELEERVEASGKTPKCECGGELAVEGAPDGYAICIQCGRGYSLDEVQS